MNVPDYKIDGNYEGKNKERLLVLSGANKDIDLTCSPNYIMPKDPSNKLAISVHYYSPPTFAIEPDKNPWTFIHNSVLYEIPPLTKWGDESHYTIPNPQFLFK